MAMEPELEELLRLVGAPVEPVEVGAPDAPAWRAVEYRLGLELPSDFKALIATFGNAQFADFLGVLSPFSSNAHIHLERRANKLLGAAHETRRKNPTAIPYALFPETCGLFPWGVTDNGDALFWLTEGPSSWWHTVVLEARGS